jgi:hypothetical protein
MSERRKSKRQKSFLRGCIYFNDRRAAIDCLVRDISEAGAKLIFSEAVQTPDVIELHIPQRKQQLRAQVQWRNGDEMGVLFPDAMTVGADKNDAELDERMHKLEAEIAALKRIVKKLKTEIGSDSEAA